MVLLEAASVKAGFGPATTLDGASLAVAEQEIVAIVGPSGSGKSTLLFCLAGLLRPRHGHVRFEGLDLSAMSERERSGLRLRRFGFVFQFGDLVPELTVVENVELPLRFAGVDRSLARKRAVAALASLGVEHVGRRRTFEMSGGEQQRAAVARAIVHCPRIIFADEPTGALDEDSAALVLAALADAVRAKGASVVLVTHDLDTTRAADRVFRIHRGRLEESRPAA